MKLVTRILALTIIFFLKTFATNAQAELQPWGNLAGIRIEGQLMDFETSIAVVGHGWSTIKTTGKERQRPKYERKGAMQVVTTIIDSLYFTETVTDGKKSSAVINLQVIAKEFTPLEGIYVKLIVPDAFYPIGTIMYNDYEGISLSSNVQLVSNYLRKPIKELHLMTAKRDLYINFDSATNVLFREEKSKGDIQHAIYIPVSKGSLEPGAKVENSFTIRATGIVDKSPVTLKVNTENTGRVFDGFGGNFRLQNPKTDPQVIDYCLQNLRVAWGRVEMPFRFWQENKNDDPLSAAKKGNMHPAVKSAMEMAQRLGKMGMPVILSCWSAPAWAVVGTPKFQPGPDGVWGNPLDTANLQAMYKSIADYVQFLRDDYGVEISMFSFNESDLGINIRQTAEEHLALIKGLGAYFEQRGLKTKMLLGDNSDATTFDFINPSLYDTTAHRYIGAISFHSWRGWEKQTLQKWADAATQINRSLIVGEGSIDAQAWGYPAIFDEPSYALDEINLYTRLLNTCQPASILQWQLTADYSPLVGGGIFGNNEPLRPTQRFYNLRQLSATPAGLQAIEAVSDKADVTVAALGDKNKNVYTLHVVNNSAARMAIIRGLPETVKYLNAFVTNKNKPMAAAKRIAVSNGIATVQMDERSYYTFISE